MKDLQKIMLEEADLICKSADFGINQITILLSKFDELYSNGDIEGLKNVESQINVLLKKLDIEDNNMTNYMKKYTKKIYGSTKKILSDS